VCISTPGTALLLLLLLLLVLLHANVHTQFGIGRLYACTFI
jgi:hypothetical protein